MKAFILKYATIVTSAPGYRAQKTVSHSGIAGEDPILNVQIFVS